MRPRRAPGGLAIKRPTQPRCGAHAGAPRRRLRPHAARPSTRQSPHYWICKSLVLAGAASLAALLLLPVTHPQGMTAPSRAPPRPPLPRAAPGRQAKGGPARAGPGRRPLRAALILLLDKEGPGDAPRSSAKSKFMGTGQPWRHTRTRGPRPRLGPRALRRARPPAPGAARAMARAASHPTPRTRGLKGGARARAAASARSGAWPTHTRARLGPPAF
ncbi:MAG: hypothetical protein J3K34DRAFT_403359 [Monoraphidium minutum]|nr:MAG: hypothetical protein J3K34DRAFT_403359 [Monoraphidium minutum]